MSLVGCEPKPKPATAIAEATSTGRDLLERTIKEFHHAADEAQGAERARLLREASTGYERLLATEREPNLCAQAQLGLGNIRALQGKTNEAVKLYANVSEKYPGRDWEVLQAWKSAADLLWEARRHDEARKYYTRLIERFDKADAPMITRSVVRGSKMRLAE